MERLYVWLNLSRDLWKSMLQAMSKLNLLEYLARIMLLLLLMLIPDSFNISNADVEGKQLNYLLGHLIVLSLYTLREAGLV